LFFLDDLSEWQRYKSVFHETGLAPLSCLFFPEGGALSSRSNWIEDTCDLMAKVAVTPDFGDHQYNHSKLNKSVYVGDKQANLGQQINFKSACKNTVTKLEVGDMVIFLYTTEI